MNFLNCNISWFLSCSTVIDWSFCYDDRTFNNALLNFLTYLGCLRFGGILADIVDSASLFTYLLNAHSCVKPVSMTTMSDTFLYFTTSILPAPSFQSCLTTYLFSISYPMP